MAQIEELVFSDNNEQKERVAGKESENNKSGGVISNLISALSPVAKAEDVLSSGEKMNEEKSGGVISNLVAGILHQSEDKEKNKENGEGINEQLDKEEGGIVGGLVDNLVANLPSPLADDAAPATEEASILIHSIVHD